MRTLQIFKGGRRVTVLGLVIATVALAAIVVSGATLTSGGAQPTASALASNPYLDPGSHLSGPAPDSP
jgi:hypothetical protein